MTAFPFRDWASENLQFPGNSYPKDVFPLPTLTFAPSLLLSQPVILSSILTFHFYLLALSSGEGHGNPLQCSCLENPMDGGAWWAAVYGVPHSRTRLKWLSSNRVGHDWSDLAAAAALSSVSFADKRRSMVVQRKIAWFIYYLLTALF